MDVLVIHPAGEGPPAKHTLAPLLDLVSLCGRLREDGLSVAVVDGSFDSLPRMREAIDRAGRPRIAIVHALRGDDSAALFVERFLKEDGLVVVAFGKGIAVDPSPHLEAGADCTVSEVDAAAQLLELLSVHPWGSEPARIPALESLLEVRGVSVLDLEGRLRAGAVRTDAPVSGGGWLPAYDVLDLGRHLAFTEARSGQRVLPVQPTPTRTREHGQRLARELKRLVDHAPFEVRFLDADLAENRPFLRGLCDGLDELASGVTWSARVGPHHVDQPLLEKMQAAGCRRVTLFVDAIAERRGAVESPLMSDAERVARASNHLGVEVGLELGVGHPGETPQDLQLALRWVEQLAPHKAQLVWKGPGQLRAAERQLLNRLAEAARSGEATGRRALLGLWLGWRALRPA